ncbi:oxidase [Sulfurisphaera ohwakuensis]|uniref:Oxidase n=1 Tax=Sulfurisphaera ohwakuensis TaxID=69656 RepID=A0A650CIP7_SULOH|nr:oxidase [Sulfurisphaera ohwakuensis]MBB5253369.1 terminal oxidase subunit [Sulfurisphaera ohwakuensis]QGR17690.1 oxidase [Sulfurisphaera ohwakuensis]
MKKETWEWIWTGFAILLLAIVVVTTLPQVFTVGGTSTVFSADIPSNTPTSMVIQTTVYAEEYVFMVQEHGGGIDSELVLPNGTVLPYYYNLMVVHPGQYLNMTMYAVMGKTATENMYIPVYNSKYVVDTQIVPGLTQYAVWYAATSSGTPIAEGAYAFLDGEYNGPWFSYDVGEILVIPTSGYFSPNDISSYISSSNAAHSSGLVGDPYNPPIIVVSGSSPVLYAVSDKYAAFNDSIPGPTFIINANSTATLKLYIPTPDNDHNWLDNYTASGTPEPMTGLYVGVYAVWWNGTITPVAYQMLNASTYNTYMTFTFRANAPAYVYGIIYPAYYVYNLDGMSNPLTGEQAGYLMSLWGTILVEG